MFVVDSNVLIDATNDLSPFHAKCRGLLDSWRKQPSPWFLTWAICFEFLRVSTHPRVLRPPLFGPRAWNILQSLFASKSLAILVPTERHAAVAKLTLDELPYLAGNIMHDTHTAVLMREHGVRRIYTRDTDFHRFPFLEPVDPTVP